MKSMTGFGRGVAGDEGRRVVVTVQGWNHRNADLVFRLPEAMRPLEAGLRERVRRQVERGRCEISVRLEAANGGAGVRRLDREGLARFLADSADLVASGTIERRWTLGDLARSPFVIAQAEAEEPDTWASSVAGDALAVALEAFDAARCAEGARLAAHLCASLAELRELVEKVAERRDRGTARIETQLRERLDEILPGGSAGLPPERLAQEIVLLADRSDVREELERLRGHFTALAGIFDEAGPHGRRLEFLVQEVLRELNTLGSKSRDLETTRWVVEAKVVNERMREQIQNVE